MASAKKIGEIIAAIKTIYPYYAKDTAVGILAETWKLLLNDYPDAAVSAAFMQCLKECKMPPTPADVIERLNAMQESLEPSAEELWSVYSDALRDAYRISNEFSYTYRDASGLTQGEQARRRFESLWDGLPDTIKAYCASSGELLRMAREFGYGADMAYEKARFIKMMPVMKKRAEYSGYVSEIGGAEMLRIGDGRK